MRKYISLFAAAAILAVACAKTETPVEEPTTPPGGPEKVYAATTITASIDNGEAGDTRTAYTVDEDNGKAFFSWKSGDQIDVYVSYDSGKVFSAVAFETTDTDVSASFSDDVDNTVLTVEEILDAHPDAALSDWAFYPSNLWQESTAGGFKFNWSVVENKKTDEYPAEAQYITFDIPNRMTPPLSNELAIIPLVGKKDADEYVFTPVTGVLGIKVTNLPDDIDYLTLTSDSYPLSGSFHLTQTGATGKATSADAIYSDDAGITLSVSGLPSEHTFYVPVVEGTIPAGLTLTIGSSSDPDAAMVVTTQKPLSIVAGQITMCPSLTFKEKDQQWTKVADGKFLDDFMWARHSAYTADTWVEVEIEQSGLHPEKFRIANPYTTANATFGYTPYAAGIVADDYLIFKLEAEDMVSFNTFRLGIEDKDSGGKPMQITYPKNWSASKTGKENKVLSYMNDGSGLPFEVQLAAIYSDPDNSGYMYSRDGEGSADASRIHILFADDPGEGWDEVLTGTFEDTLIWGLQSFASPVDIKLEQSSADPSKFRIANPYLAAASAFGYTSYTSGIEGAEYLEFTVLSDDKVQFTTFNAGIEDKPSGGKPMKIWYPTDWGDSYVVTYNKVVTYLADGLPQQIQLAPVYSDVDPSNYSYKYTKNESPTIFINFTDLAASWTSLGTGRYVDEFLWKANSFAPYAVEVEVERNGANSNYYRITNPYPVANTAFSRTAATGTADEYMYFTVDPSTGLVTYETLVTGMTKGTSSADQVNFAISHPATWNSLKGTSLSSAGTKVTKGTAAAPLEIQLEGPYYNSEDNTYFYTNSTGTKYLWFPDYYVGETWTDFCEGSYVDNTYDSKINGTSTLGTVAVTIQQSSLNPQRFRLTNPYRTLDASLQQGTSDDYLYFQYGNGLVYFDYFQTGVMMDNSSRDLVIAHPVYGNINSLEGASSDFNGSSVLSATTSGAPRQIQLGAYYHDKNAPSYRYTRGGSSYSTSDRIVITFDADKAVVSHVKAPLFAGQDNQMLNIDMPSGNLTSLKVKITGIDPAKVKGFYTMQGGTYMGSTDFAPDSEGIATITPSSPAFSGTVGVYIKFVDGFLADPSLSIGLEVLEAVVDSVSYPLFQDKTEKHYMAVKMNFIDDVVNVRGTDETVKSFRIPALVTTNSGALIAAYDIRYASSTDLQGDIDVGMKRSTDGGKTWSDLKIIMDMGEYGGLGQDLNGIGDPCLLVDEVTGDIMCFAVWAHDHDNARCIYWAGAGYDPADTPQLMMVRSSDDGLTWSDPINLTRQVKQNDWWMTFQGPGRGITMADGTLVVPIQHQEGSRSLNAGIMYSTDHGLTWRTHNYARAVTSESAVAEIEPGKLMLTMRDETNSRRRAVFTTTNMGRSWTAHSTDGKVPEPTCMASLLHVNAADNSLGRDVLLFSNPDNGESTGRIKMTIKASLDRGETWSHKLLLNQGLSAYSCLTMVDNSTVGILYEYGTDASNIVFMSIPLEDIIKE